MRISRTLLSFAIAGGLPVAATAQVANVPTFTKDIAPIFQ